MLIKIQSVFAIANLMNQVSVAALTYIQRWLAMFLVRINVVESVIIMQKSSVYLAFLNVLLNLKIEY